VGRRATDYPPFSIDGPNLLSDPSVSPLMRALGLGDMELAKSLIAAGANVNAADRQGNTALIIAANRVELGALRQLLVSGASVGAKNHDGLTALFCTDSLDIASELVEHGADVNATSRFNITPLMGVVAYDPSIVRLLIANGANVNARDVEGGTALMQAALLGRAYNVKILVEAGPDVNARDNKGGTALSRVQWRIDTWSPEDPELEVVTENKKQLGDFRAISKLLKRAGAIQ
jgi:ankyrin repeat protein